MDRIDPPQRPSIFARPDVDDEPRAPVQPPTPTSQTDRPPVYRPLPREAVGPSGPSRGLVVGIGGAALLLLVIGGFVAASILGPGDDDLLAAGSPSASASASATASQSERATSTAGPTLTASPIPTPTPTPAGPPQDLPAGGWATVAVEELNVRSAADTNATSNYLLVRGAVVHVAEGPTTAGGLNWYRIASLGGATGWATSGWVAEPFMTTLVDDPTLIRCGKVARPVFDVVDGAPVPHDPLAVGDMSLPVSAFSDFSLGAMELLRGVGDEACFSAQVDSNETPAINTQLNVTACGRVVREGDFFRLRPAAGQTVPPETQVKDPAIVHPAVLAGGPPDDRLSTGLRSVLTLVANGSDATGCINLNVDEEPGTGSWQSVSTSQCFIVHEHAADGITLNAAAGGDSVRLLVSPGSSPPWSFVMGAPTPLSVHASVSEYERGVYVWQGYEPDCS